MNEEHHFPRVFPISAEWLAKQLKTAEGALSDIETQLDQTCSNDTDQDVVGMPTSSESKATHAIVDPTQSTSAKCLSRLYHDLQLLDFSRRYQLVLASTLTESLTNDTPLSTIVQLLRGIGLLLLRYEIPTTTNTSPTSAYNVFYDQVIRNFSFIYKKAHAKAVLNLRRLLRKSGYPSANGCEFIKSQLLNAHQIGVLTHIESDVQNEDDIAPYVTYLCILQQIHDKISSHLKNSSFYISLASNHHAGRLTDEFFRPIVERVRYHFLPTDTNNTEESKTDNSQDPNKATLSTSSRLDHLPSWLFDYLQSLLETNGVWFVVRHCVQPIFHVVSLDIEKAVNHERIQPHPASGINLSIDKIHVDFWRSLTKLIVHILTKRNFFSDPSIVGAKGEDESHVNALPLCDAIEQILHFDEYGIDLLKEEGGSFDSTVTIHSSYSLTSIFLTSDQQLFNWWLTMEKNQAFCLLQESFTSETKDYMKERADISLLPESETFISIFHSLERKMSFLPYRKHQAEFHAKTIVPLCMNYMDLMHHEASILREVVEKKFRMEETDITSKLKRWISITSGIFIVAFIIQRKIQKTIDSDLKQDMERMHRSFIQLSDAMVMDFIDHFGRIYEMDELKALILRSTENEHHVVCEFWKRALNPIVIDE